LEDIEQMTLKQWFRAWMKHFTRYVTEDNVGLCTFVCQEFVFDVWSGYATRFEFQAFFENALELIKIWVVLPTMINCQPIKRLSMCTALMVDVFNLVWNCKRYDCWYELFETFCGPGKWSWLEQFGLVSWQWIWSHYSRCGSHCWAPIKDVQLAKRMSVSAWWRN
jgi:hypothetical protein